MKKLEFIKKELNSLEMKQKFINSGISHLSLFGSYARNEATKNSDLDLLIELDGKQITTIGLLQELEDLLVNKFSVKKVDFVTKRKLNPLIKSYIEKDLITIF